MNNSYSNYFGIFLPQNFFLNRKYLKHFKKMRSHIQSVNPTSGECYDIVYLDLKHKNIFFLLMPVLAREDQINCGIKLFQVIYS